MNIAVLGATSQIAKDLVLSFSAREEHQLTLFARRTNAVIEWLLDSGLSAHHRVKSFEAFTAKERFDAIINFVGIGNPARAVAIGLSIFKITREFDEMALDYLDKHPQCRYVFLSSGAAYGSDFSEPADRDTRAAVAINNLRPQDWYGVAKLHAECRHRSLPNLAIVDIRVFSYFSHTQDLSARFLITDILHAIRSGETLITSGDNIVRDYIAPADLYSMITLILAAPPANDVVDSYTKAPVDKMTLLSTMSARLGLKYEVNETTAGLNATGLKPKYFSKNRRAETYGYYPGKDSLANVLDESKLCLMAYVR
jgi:nucleoside-diphosphate-sugar epimerase